MFPPINKSRFFLEKHKVSGKCVQYKTRTKPSLSRAMATLRELERTDGFHPEREPTSHPTIGAEAEINYFDLSPEDRWNPQLRERQKEKKIDAKPKRDQNNSTYSSKPKTDNSSFQRDIDNRRGISSRGTTKNLSGTGNEPPSETKDTDVQDTMIRKELPDNPPTDSRKKPHVPLSKRPTVSHRLIQRYDIEDDPLTQMRSAPTNASQIRDLLRRTRQMRQEQSSDQKQ